MPVHNPRRRAAPAALRFLAFGLTAGVACSAAAGLCLAAETPLPGYCSFEALASRIRALDGQAGANVQSLGRTAQGRDVLCVDIGAAGGPGIAVLGSVDADRPCCAESALRLAEQLCSKAGSDGAVAALLGAAHLRIIPCPSPDAYAALFTSPYSGSPRNGRPTDEDDDGALDEDGPDDLDGDGWITTLRVRDGGGLMPHPLDPRVLIEADRSKGETGGWSLVSEGKDNDGDGQMDEDPRGGVDFNRNWTFLYPYFAADAGPHQVSEPETRAVADALCADHSIAVVLALGRHANLAPLWQPNGGAEGREVKTTLLSADAPYYNRLAEVLKGSLSVDGAPPAPGGEGGFVQWAYFHYGRLSLCVNPWWPPMPAPPEKKEEKKDEAKGEAPASEPPVGTPLGASAVGAGLVPPAPEGGRPANPGADNTSAPQEAADGAGAVPSADRASPGATESTPAETPKWDESDKRGQGDRDLLAWYEQQGLDGFQPWKRIEHPDYPGLEVEVGGFRPLLRSNPPAAELDAIADKQLAFLTALGRMLPRLEVRQAQVEALGDGVYRLKARFANNGELPTMTAMGDLSRIPFPLQVTLTLPDGASLLAGLTRQRAPRLEGGAVGDEMSWLILAPQGGKVGIAIESPMAGSAEISVKLEGN